MRNQIPLKSSVEGHMASTRVSALPLRQAARELLSKGSEVILDFNGIQATQSFIDELIGALILEDGPQVLENIVFKGCSEDVEAMIRFVAADRCDQFSKAHAH